MTYAISGNIWYHTVWSRGSQKLNISFGYVDTVLCSRYTDVGSAPDQEITIDSRAVLNPGMDKSFDEYELVSGTPLSADEIQELERVKDDSSALVAWLKANKWQQVSGEYYTNADNEDSGEIDIQADVSPAEIARIKAPGLRESDELYRIVELANILK